MIVYLVTNKEEAEQRLAEVRRVNDR